MIFSQSDPSAPNRRFYLYLVDATDNVTPETGEAGGQPKISKAGGAPVNTTGVLVSVGTGDYYVELTSTEINTLGTGGISYKSAATAQFSAPFQVVAPSLFTAGTGFPTIDSFGRVDVAKLMGMAVSSIACGHAAISTTVIQVDSDEVFSGGSFVSMDDIVGCVVLLLGEGPRVVESVAFVSGTLWSVTVDYAYPNLPASSDALFLKLPGIALTSAGRPKRVTLVDTATTVTGLGANAVTAAAIAADTGLKPQDQGTAQSGASTSITLRSGASSSDNYYRGCIVVITGGTGAGQSKLIRGYTGSVRLASINGTWVTTPDSTSIYAVLPFGVTIDASNGNISVDVATIQANAVNNASIAADAITAAKVAADVGTEIRNAMGLAASNLDTQLAAIAGYIDTEVSSLVTSVGSLTTSMSGLTTTVNTVAGYVDTEVAAIKAVTDKLDTALVLDGAVWQFTVNALELGPVGGGGVADWNADERTAIRAILGVPGSGTTPATPSTGVLATIEGRVTPARAGYLDNLNLGGLVASGSQVTALYNMARVSLDVPPQILVPPSGTKAFVVTASLYDADTGEMEAPDSTPTLTATLGDGTDVSARLSASTNPATGVYRWTYTSSSAHALNDQVRFDVAFTENAAAIRQTASGYTVTAIATDFSASDRTALLDAQTKAGTAATQSTAGATSAAAAKAVTDKLDTALQLDGAVYRFTANALELAPTGSGGGGGTTGTGADTVTINITIASVAVADADVWITSDAAGLTVVAGTKQTNSAGNVVFLLDAGVTYYLWMQKDGVNPILGSAFTAVAD